jgi:hypothetical protein
MIYYLLFLSIYLLGNVMLSVLIHYFIKEKVVGKRLAWSYSISISLGISFIITLIFIARYFNDLVQYF